MSQDSEKKIVGCVEEAAFAKSPSRTQSSWGPLLHTPATGEKQKPKGKHSSKMKGTPADLNLRLAWLFLSSYSNSLLMVAAFEICLGAPRSHNVETATGDGPTLLV